MPSRRLNPLLTIGLAVALATGCASLPTHGDIHLGRVVPAPGGLTDVDVRVFPPSWHAGLPPAAVVSGFLHAVVNDDDDYAIARSYLSTSAAASWRPDVGLTTYDDSALRTTFSGARVTIRAPRLGHIDRRGGYQPAPGTLTATFTMSRSDGNWRIDHLADGVLLSAADAQRAFRMAPVYYLNRAGTTLVPDRVLLRESQRGIATALMSALLSGPSGWLAPAVRTDVPSGTGLIGNVPVHDDGVADVDLSSAARSVSPADLVGLSAQIVWTLRQVSGVTAVRLFADGAPLTVAGQPQRQPVTAWPSFDPAAAPPSADLFYVANGRVTDVGAAAAAVRRSDPSRAVSVARARRGQTLAVVQQTATGARLLTGRLGHPLTARVSATTMTAPTFDVDGDVVTVVAGGDGQHVVAVDAAGHVRRVGADAALLRQQVTMLRISRDGARVAAVVDGRLMVGRVAGSGETLSIGGLRAIAPALHDVSGVAWSGADTVVVTAAAAGPTRQVVETDTDGYAVRTIDLRGVDGTPTDVAAAPGEPLVVTAGGRLWIDDQGWRTLARGAAAVYSG